MVKRADYTTAQQGRLEALAWAGRMMADLRAVVARDPADRQARADASLILSAVDELVTGREPRSITGKRGRMTRTPSPEEWQRLWRVRGLRQRISRPSVRRRKQASAGVGEPQDEGFWGKLAQLVGLDGQEVMAIRTRAGRGAPLREVARALGVSRRQAEQITTNAQRKLDEYTRSRQLRSLDELKATL